MANPVKTICKVVEVVYHSETVSSVFLLPEKRVKFKPGQFLHLALENYDPQNGFWPESRIFSIASSPDNDLIRVTYSIKGKFTARMREVISKDKEIWIKYPYGQFIIGDENNIILVAGGTGITPFIPFLICESQRSSLRNIHLFYGVRKKGLFIFEREIISAVEKLENFKYSFYCEEEDLLLPNNIKVKKGIIDSKDLQNYISERNITVYLSGPLIMIDSFRKLLTSYGVKDESIKIDEWE